MATRAEDRTELRKVYRDHNLHILFGVTLAAVPIGFLVHFSLRNPEPHNDQSLKEYFGDILSRLRAHEVLGLLGAYLTAAAVAFALVR